MKKLGKIKLNQFSKNELKRRRMNALRGGNDCSECTCSCTSVTFPSSDSPIRTNANTAIATPKSSSYYS
jgi:natural product precursor